MKVGVGSWGEMMLLLQEFWLWRKAYGQRLRVWRLLLRETC